MNVLKHVDFEVPAFGELAQGPQTRLGYRSEVLADNPVGYWRLGEAGPTAADSGSGGNDGTMQGTYVAQQSGAIAFDSDTSLDLNGSSGRVLIGDFHDFVNRAPFTVEAWARSDSFAAAQHIMFKRDVSNTDGWIFGFSAGAQLRITRRHGGSSTSQFESGTSSTGTWYHCVATYDGTDLLLYKNNTVYGPTTSTGNIEDISDNLHIGCNSGVSGGFFNGKLDEVAVYNTALSATRIAAHYNAGIGQ
jgi:hypothetical protein